ncbi:hypothetical protein [Anianabacter salinae]|uniref:hypothetical protein n=1 Tax=Anianabacter salinae TaxID=2851023 RepID=UPI00225E401D|nr:hypothetical protein [Anianabacter salinae]MBV0913812.1 hypothetical protein [Anianabacter salinae]
MQSRNQTTRRASVAKPAFAVLVSALAATLLMPVSAEAQGFGFRAGAASGQNGAIAGSRGVISNGQGGGAIGRNFVIGDGQGNGAARSGGCAANVNAAGCSGRVATWGSDGTFSGAAATEITSENGFFSGNRSLDRDADGTWSGTSEVDASGLNGSYSGNASLDDGTYSRDATYSGTEGQSATVEGAYELGSGGSRSVTCIDASGAVVNCP